MNVNDAIHMAARYANQGMLDQAEKVCRDIIKANDKYHPAYHLLGQLSFHSGKDDIAIQMLQKAVSLDTGRATYHRDLAEVLCFTGNHKAAKNIIDQALLLNPNDPKSHYIAGMVLTALNALDQAIGAYQTVVRLSPKHGLAYNNLGALLETKGQSNEAKKAYIKAIKINKEHAEAQNNLATILIAEGDTKGAKKHLEAAINARPTYIEAHHNLSALKKYKKGEEHITQLEAAANDLSALSVENKVRLHFTLGKVYSDIGKIDAAFNSYQSGNNMKRASIQYDEKAAKNLIDEIKNTFNHTYLKNPLKDSNDDPTAIFIVGMPRSGSTLIEQILASHSDVHAGGELRILNNIIKSKITKFPQDVPTLPDEKLKAIGEEYLHYIKGLNPDAKRIVDKMPANYHYAGLIAKILPDAHIINSNRDPMDSCLSNYIRLFLETIPYTYDLGELGRYYVRYQNLINHWHEVIPQGLLIDIGYEDVVANLEKEARKIIDFVGLDWEDSCLDFHKNKRRVETASAAQVRKPIYKTSIEKWRPYEKHLGPLIEALKNAPSNVSS